MPTKETESNAAEDITVVERNGRQYVVRNLDEPSQRSNKERNLEGRIGGDFVSPAAANDEYVRRTRLVAKQLVKGNVSIEGEVKRINPAEHLSGVASNLLGRARELGVILDKKSLIGHNGEYYHEEASRGDSGSLLLVFNRESEPLVINSQIATDEEHSTAWVLAKRTTEEADSLEDIELQTNPDISHVLYQARGDYRTVYAYLNSDDSVTFAPKVGIDRQERAVNVANNMASRVESIIASSDELLSN